MRGRHRRIGLRRHQPQRGFRDCRSFVAQRPQQPPRKPDHAGQSHLPPRRDLLIDAALAAAFARMAADPARSLAFQAARALVFEGAAQPNGYTEPLLHAYRRRLKSAR